MKNFIAKNYYMRICLQYYKQQLASGSHFNVKFVGFEININIAHFVNNEEL